ncbi:MAG: protein kinase domain-containing protein [Myxococcota bacterium]
MARIYRFGQPENASESKAIRWLAERLPDSYLLVHNFELTTGYGMPYEYDIAVVGSFCVWHVEVKGYRGTIRGDMNQWIFDNGRVQPSPIPLANKKSKILASKLKKAAEKLGRVWVDTAILITDDRARIKVRDDQATRIIRLEDAPDYLSDPKNVPVKTRDILFDHDAIYRALFGNARPGQKVKQIGLYDVIERISQSDTRTVFLAKHRIIKTRPETILKVFHFDVYRQEEARQRQIESIFHDQGAMRLLGAHPNLIDTADMFAWEDDKFVLPTEYVPEGRPLKMLLEDEDDKGVSWSEKADWIIKMARGLKHAHTHGVIHRDIRPLNVVIGPGGVVKLVNFDLAFIKGTPHPELHTKLAQRFDARYVAPEVLADPTAATPASDVYSLGILFYELLTGETPYKDIAKLSGETPLDRELLMKELSTPGSEDFMDSPQDAVEVLERMTRQDPVARYQGVDEVLEDLAILEDE